MEVVDRITARPEVATGNQPHHYGKYFAELIEGNVKTLLLNHVRERNPGAPFIFGENHFREHLRSGRHTLPAHWSQLVIERKVLNDVDDVGQEHGCIDYFFSASGAAAKPDLREVLATCEVGGPTRRALLKGSKKNWYKKIVADIRKQVGRASIAPLTQHYLGLMIVPRSNSDLRSDLKPVFDSMLVEVPQAQMTESSWTDLEHVSIIVMRVERRV